MQTLRQRVQAQGIQLLLYCMCRRIHGKARRLVYQARSWNLYLMLKYAIFALFAITMIGMVYAQEGVKLGPHSGTKTIEVGKQVQIAADLKNNQDFEQDFAYIVQVQNRDGITVSLAWITGTLSPAQSFSPSLSWTPTEAGEFEATIFVWESIDNPSALSPTLSLKIDAGQAV